MAYDNVRWASIPGRFIHGTATPAPGANVVPNDKSAKEVFWVQELVRRLPEFSLSEVQVIPNKDDSFGNHDVLIRATGQSVVGVQVTELTYELSRARSAKRNQYLGRVITELQRHNVFSPTRVVVSLFFASIDPQKLDLVPAKDIVTTIASEVHEITADKIITTPYGQVVLSPVDKGEFYIPNHGNIGVDVSFDQLPVSADTFKTAVDYLVGKKKASKSPWLVIWSVGFARYKHFLGNEVVAYMQDAFRATPFARVLFIESMDHGEEKFMANLCIYSVK